MPIYLVGNDYDAAWSEAKIKVGFSHNWFGILKRIKSQFSSPLLPQDVYLLGLVDGDESYDSYLRNKILKHLNIKGDYFVLNDEIKKIILNQSIINKIDIKEIKLIEDTLFKIHKNVEYFKRYFNNRDVRFDVFKEILTLNYNYGCPYNLNKNLFIKRNFMLNMVFNAIFENYSVNNSYDRFLYFNETSLLSINDITISNKWCQDIKRKIYYEKEVAKKEVAKIVSTPRPLDETSFLTVTSFLTNYVITDNASANTWDIRRTPPSYTRTPITIDVLNNQFKKVYTLDYNANRARIRVPFYNQNFDYNIKNLGGYFSYENKCYIFNNLNFDLNFLKLCLFLDLNYIQYNPHFLQTYFELQNMNKDKPVFYRCRRGLCKLYIKKYNKNFIYKLLELGVNNISYDFNEKEFLISKSSIIQVGELVDVFWEEIGWPNFPDITRKLKDIHNKNAHN